MVERSGVYVYAHDDVDITATGLVGDLLPIKCTFTEEKNGKSLIEMQLHYDQWGKWRAVKPGNYIKALVPVRVPPKIVNNLFAESVTTYRLKKSITKEVTVYVSNGTKSIDPVNPENFRLHYVVDTGMERVPVKKKSTLTTDMDVQILEEKDDGRCKVYHPSFGSGWTFKDNLEQVKTDAIRQTIDGVEGVAEAVKLQYQLFQIDQVEQTLRHINVTANHVFYELSRNYTTYKNEADMEAFVTINGVMENLVAPDARFSVLTDCSDSGGAVDYDQQNVVQAFLDPENGICARYGLSLLRDNYDIYALKEVGSDRGFVVEYAKNMLGVNRTEDITDTFTRLIPWGQDKNGNPVYLDEKHIDSPHLSDYAFPRIAYLDCSDSATESDTMTIAQVKEELRRRAQEEFDSGVDLPALSMTVDFVSIGDTEEYRQYRNLDKVYLFDRITVRDKVRMYDYNAEVVGMRYNVLTRRVEKAEIGSIRKGTGVRKVPAWQVPTIDGGNIRLASIDMGAIKPGAITEEKLNDGAVTVNKLAAGSITADKMAAGVLSADLIDAGSITTDKLAAGAVTADKIASGTIAAIGIQAGSITTDKLAAGAVTADKIASGAISAIGIEANSITTDKLAAGAVTAQKIATGTITAESGIIANSAIGTAQVADGSITAAKIVSLNADVINAGTLKAERLLLVGDDGVIYKINAASSGLSMSELDDYRYKHYLNGTVIVAKSITAAQMAARTITANEILTETITANELAANAVTADKIAANAITASKIASDVGGTLDISSNKAITNLVRDMDALPTTHVQFVEPTNAQKGDIWINTGESTWADLKKMTWGGVAANQWGAYLNTTPATRVWDGAKWQVLADQAVIKDQYTRITQTEEKISQMATKTKLSGVEERVSTAEEKITPEAITNTVTSSAQYKNDLAGKASTGDVTNLANRVNTAEQKITPEAITNTVRTSTDYKNDLGSKVSQTIFDQTNNQISARIETVDQKASATPTKVVNTALTLDTNGIDMHGGQINIRAGSALTVDAPNFNLDAAGNAVMKNASVSGNLTNNGIAVLTAKNLVVSSTQPTAPVPGMVWVKPVGSTAATFLYNNTTLQSFKAFETAHTLTNAGTAVSASGTYTYNVRIPYKVTGTVNATRYLTMMVGNTAIFTDVALEKTAGTYVLELSGNLSAWLGNANSLSFTLNLHYMGGDDGTLHNVHRVDVGAIDLKLYAKSNAASGWSGTEVQVYNG